MLCICGSEALWSDCCRPFLVHGKSALTAEMLMRSRYSAYVRRDGAYLYKTWSSTTRPSKASLMQLPLTEWTGLTILRTEAGGAGDSHGMVEFMAHWQNAEGVAQVLHEISQFVREKGRWVYLSGSYN